MQCSTQELSELVSRKLHLLREIRRMTLQQEALVADRDVDRLLTLLSRKNDAMDGLRTVQTALATFGGEDPETRQWESSEARQACRDELQQCNRLIAELLQLEQAAIDRLTRDRELIGRQLQQVHSGESIEQAYSVADVSTETHASFSLQG